ncbi:MAG: ASCH domain-containing protein [Acidobacteriota bacterium]|nr:ASCH domain-containing protein [Acidobacteriota bacterium]
MKFSERVVSFWREFCAQNTQVDPGEPFQAWFFSNTHESAKELVELVLAGKKTATASLAAINEIDSENAPVVGGYSVVTDFDGNPFCILQTVEVRQLPFESVDAAFAFDEGEGDQSLEYWRDCHWKYFSEEAAQMNIEFNEKSLITCERFKLLFPAVKK